MFQTGSRQYGSVMGYFLKPDNPGEPKWVSQIVA